MRRRLSVFLRFLVGGSVLVALAACGDASPPSSEDGPRFVTTIAPFELVLTPLVEGRGTVERLLAPGASPHTYDPTPTDLRAVREGAALIYGADHLDGWAADLPAERRLALVNLVPDPARLYFDEGGHAHDDEPGTRSETVDPHFWTDPQAVARLLPVLVDTLCSIDAPGCATYRANADSFATTLNALDTKLRTRMKTLEGTPVLLAQPFFRYFLRRYGLLLVDVVEPNPGSEPTARRIQALVDRATETEVRAILTQRQMSTRAAESVAEAASIPLVPLDPIGGTEGRTTYSGLLLHNARTLREALGRPSE